MITAKKIFYIMLGSWIGLAFLASIVLFFKRGNHQIYQLPNNGTGYNLTSYQLLVKQTNGTVYLLEVVPGFIVTNRTQIFK